MTRRSFDSNDGIVSQANAYFEDIDFLGRDKGIGETLDKAFRA